MGKLEGNVALVTGSSQGIGAAIAVKLAQEGAGRRHQLSLASEEGEAVKQQVLATGRRAIAIGADLGAVDSINKLIADSVAGLASSTSSSTTPAWRRNASFWDVSEKDYDLVLNTQPQGARSFATQAFVKHLQSRQSPGKIIQHQLGARGPCPSRISPPTARARAA